MKVIKSIMVLFAGLASVSVYGQAQSPEYMMIHGSACQAANLGQAINFNASWSQNGITNPNALGSGRSFFVICPVVTTDDLNGQDANGADIRVHMVYSDHDGVTDTSCFARRYKGGEVILQVNATDNRAAGFTGDSDFQFSNITDSAVDFFDGLRDIHTIVCALPPQATLQGIAYDHD